ncbi:MAG: prepilin-type N-terminal cleavage/methylation domain-containing protein [Rickettsiales bacterium]|nr:prepilin-type N-terminal cleavage/methylation domain-containing protein [Rickettsiales bacterium]
MPNKKQLSPSAFSLLELSIVILIIGILILGVIGSKHIIKKSRLSSAHSLTNSAPINSIADNALWLESSYDDRAFTDATTNINDIGDGDNLTSWNDSSYNQNKPTITAVGNGPTYANTINHVQAVKFSASQDDYLQIENAQFLNNTDYTIFVLEKRLTLVIITS